MSFIQFDDHYLAPEKGKQFKVLLFISLLVTVLLVRTTLAANISLGGNSALEFGQGVQMTTACTGSTPLTVTPISSFVNTSGAGSFYFSSIRVSNIPTTCYGSQFVLSAYGDTSTAPLAIFNNTATEVAVLDNSGTFIDNVDNAYMTLTTNSTSSFTAAFVTPVAKAGTVFKVTIQSAVNTIPTTCQGGAACAVGDLSPDGVGHVFYVSSGGFACGATLAQTCHYLSVAPATWSGGSQDPTKIWSNVASTSVPSLNGSLASSTTIGAGLSQTNAIVNQGSACSSTACTYAAGAARYYHSYSENWYLPNDGELEAMYSSIYNGSYASLVFFSSTEFNSTTVSTLDFSNHSIAGDLKSSTRYVRPIRAF
jgi:hypothetical protein